MADTLSTTTQQQVLVIEDEAPLRDRIMRILRFEGFDPAGSEDGQAGLEAAIANPPDAVICDVLMPEVDGYSVVRVLRANPATRHIPIIIVTALSDRPAQRRFMEMGVDDFLVKPFTTEELLGTLQAQFRKLGARRAASSEIQSIPAEAPEPKSSTTHRIGDWEYDTASRRLLHISGEESWLTAAEAKLLNVLYQNIGKPVSREQLHEGMKRAEFSSTDRSIDILVARIRRKLNDAPKSPKLIRTIRNVGYMLSA